MRKILFYLVFLLPNLVLASEDVDITAWSGSTGAQTIYNANGITITAYVQTKTYNNTGSTKVGYISGTNYLIVRSTSANITSITLTGNTDDNTKTVSAVVETSANGSTWANYTTSSIGTFSNRKSTPTAKTIDFETPQQYVRFSKSSSSYISIGAVSVTKSGASCSTPDAPTEVTAGSTTSSGTTLTITDEANAASYDIYYSTSNDLDEDTEATTTSTSKTPTLTGLSASTTYYVWVRSVCDESNKSDWVALTGSTFTTLCTSHTVTAATNNVSYGTAAAASASVCEGSTTTVTATPISGYSFVSWAVSGTGSSLSSTSTNPTTLTMGTANATVTATFGCATPSAPSALVASSTTSSGTTLTITDAANTNNYEIYYSDSSTAPDGETEATTTSTSKTKALTGLTASTTYYVWVRSVCDSTHKSSWTALTGSSFTTDAACTDPDLTITLN